MESSQIPYRLINNNLNINEATKKKIQEEFYFDSFYFNKNIVAQNHEMAVFIKTS
jgi:hypothetical protein